jgi:hypothetical protein
LARASIVAGITPVVEAPIFPCWPLATPKMRDPSGGPFGVTANPGNAHEIQAFAILDLAGSRKFGVNDARTCAKIDTRLTRESSRPVREAHP